ncbi:hypothetical protein [Rothia kristinae]|uniref:hypothetical protein n=1 Tax=Rothia kristinae TaxID=37923 RepID=UPI0009E371AF|nr:hypothetical protein [Rothia kristinae]
MTLPAVRHDLTSLPARDRGQQDDSHNDWTYETGAAHDRIRTFPFGTGVTLLRSAPPIITDLTAWPTRPDADTLKRDRRELEQLLQVGPAAQDE